MDVGETRRRSAAMSGNEKVVEVVLVLDALPRPATATAAEVALAAGISHGMVRDVLRRLVAADMLTAIPKIGGSRSAQYYRVSDELGWSVLAETARWARVDVVFAPIPRSGPTR